MASAGGAGRRCPWCDSTDVETVQRGFAGKTDGNDQYFRCRACGKTTWEMISKTAQEVRLGRYTAGKSSTNAATATSSSASSRSASTNYLLYLRPAPLPTPAPESAPTPQAGDPDRGIGTD